MLLRVLTTALLLLGIFLLIAWPLFVGQRPDEDAPRRAVAEYGYRAGLYFITTIITFFFVALSAFFLARQERRRLREEAHENLRELVEGTLRDHGKKRD